jgi:GNAT superfamily N-acetyltransferase
MASSAIPPTIRIREAVKSDVARLAPLCGQLGYPSSEKQVAERLAGILAAAPEHALFVAETQAGELAGFLDVFVMRTIDSDTRAEVAALVVDEEQRSQNVGQRLIERAEEWARRWGCTAIGLRSNVVRERAHRFYERLGYQHIKTQKAFRKPL